MQLFHANQKSNMNEVVDQPLAMKMGSRVELLKIYFSIGYFFGVLPYRFTKSKAAGEFFVKSNYFNTVVSYGLHAWIICRLLLNVRKTEVKVNDPLSLFKFISKCFALLHKLIFIITIWRKQEVFQKLLNEIDKSVKDNDGPPHNPWWKYKQFNMGRALPWIVCTLAIFVTVMKSLIGMRIIGSARLDFSHLIETLASFTMNVYAFTHTIASDNSTLATPSLSQGSSTYALAFVQVFTYTCQHLITSWIHLSTLMCALTFKLLVNEFCATLQSTTALFVSNHKKMIQQYYSLKTIATLMSECFGGIILGFILDEVGYATFINEHLVSNNWYNRHISGYNTIALFTTLFILANATYHIGELQDWMNEESHMHLLTVAQRIFLTNELSNSRNGISVVGLFTITYAFVGSALSVYFTYAIIAIQLVRR